MTLVNPMSEDLKEVLRQEKMSEDDILVVGRALFDCCDVNTVPLFVGYFGAEPKLLFKFWDSNRDKWEKKGSVLGHLNNALDKLIKAKDARRDEEERLLDTTLDNPIDPRTNKSLTATWEKLYGFRLHPTQEGTHQILGSIWRKLQVRQIQAEQVKGLHTLESTGGIEPNKKTWDLPGLRLVDDSQAKGKQVHCQIKSNPHLFLYALEAMLRTLAKAGSYWVIDPEDERTESDRAAQPERLNIDRELIEDHLANCRKFVIEWTTKPKPPPDHAITAQLQRIDMHLREKWCKLYRENKPEGKTFSKCIKDCAATADTLWSMDLSKEMRPPSPGGPSQSLGSQLIRKAAAKVKAKAKAKATARVENKGKGNEPPKSRAITLGKPITIKGNKVKTASRRGDNAFCNFYSNNKCKNSSKDCKYVHKCSVLTSYDRVCEGSHPACDLKGSTVKA